MLYFLTLLLLALGVYFVCLLEHNRTVGKIKENHRVELAELRRRIVALTDDTDNAVHAWQAGYKAGMMDKGRY